MSDISTVWPLRAGPRPLHSAVRSKKQYCRSAATKIIALSFEELIVFVISNQSGCSGFWGLRLQTTAYDQNNKSMNVVLLVKLFILLLKN